MESNYTQPSLSENTTPTTAYLQTYLIITFTDTFDNCSEEDDLLTSLIPTELTVNGINIEIRLLESLDGPLILTGTINKNGDFNTSVDFVSMNENCSSNSNLTIQGNYHGEMITGNFTAISDENDFDPDCINIVDPCTTSGTINGERS